MRRVAAILTAMLLTAPAIAATPGYEGRDHLWPEMSVFAYGPGTPSHAPSLATAFNSLFDMDILTRMIAERSFENPYAVAIRRKGADYAILYHVLGKSAHLKKQCEIALPMNLAKHLVAAWRDVLLGTRFSDDVATGADGASYHFGMREEIALAMGGTTVVPLSGYVWVPDPSSPPGMLVRIANTMADYCESKDVKQLTKLRNDVAALEAKLKP